VFLKYLRLLPAETANRFLVLRNSQEVVRTISAQQNFAGAAGMRELGFPRSFVSEAQSRTPAVEAAMLEMAEVQGWDIRELPGGRRRSDGPSVPFMARSVGLEKLYGFLYSATSRSVHFSITELLKQGWGKPGETLSFSPRHFECYWAGFSLYWGSYLFINIAVDVAEVLEADTLPDVDEERYTLAARRLGEFGKVPAITPDELRGP
jgi:hypothetical protein